MTTLVDLEEFRIARICIDPQDDNKTCVLLIDPDPVNGNDKSIVIWGLDAIIRLRDGLNEELAKAEEARRLAKENGNNED